jgi:hypothetical protein
MDSTKPIKINDQLYFSEADLKELQNQLTAQVRIILDKEDEIDDLIRRCTKLEQENYNLKIVNGLLQDALEREIQKLHKSLQSIVTALQPFEGSGWDSDLAREIRNIAREALGK